MIKKDKFLPIGTVCLLKGGKKRVMIAGYCVISKEQPDVIFDYNGCLFPEGIVSLDNVLAFNHDQIDKIYYMGYKDENDREFMDNLSDFILKYKSGEISIKKSIQNDEIK